MNWEITFNAPVEGRKRGFSTIDTFSSDSGDDTDLTAVDVSESRLARLSENLTRTCLAARVVAADVMTWSPPSQVDAILLDAPCSATGIFRRHPDVLHRVRPRAIAELAEGQAAMLARVAGWLKPGGRLVYSVCSLERREGEQVIAVVRGTVRSRAEDA